MNSETYHSHTASLELAVVEGTREVLGGIQRQVLCKKDKVLGVIFQEGKIYSVGKLPGVPQLVQIKGPLIEKSSFSIPMQNQC